MAAKKAGINNFDKIVERVQGTVNENVWNMAQALEAELRRQNPVDRSPTADNLVSSQNWTITISKPGEFSPMPDSFGGVTIQLPSTVKELKNVYVYSRDIPYMAKLNRGHSSQADAGWIDRAIDIVVAKFNARRKR